MIPGKNLVLPIILLAILVAGCTANQKTPVPMPTVILVPPLTPTNTSVPNTAVPEITNVPVISRYAFPESIDPSRQYMFYLHGKIIEDQGLNAVSPEYGPYEYEAILEKLGRWFCGNQRNKTKEF